MVPWLRDPCIGWNGTELAKERASGAGGQPLLKIGPKKKVQG